MVPFGRTLFEPCRIGEGIRRVEERFLCSSVARRGKRLPAEQPNVLMAIQTRAESESGGSRYATRVSLLPNHEVIKPSIQVDDDEAVHVRKRFGPPIR